MVPAYFHDMEILDNRMSVLEEKVDNLTDLVAQTFSVLKEHCNTVEEIYRRENIYKNDDKKL